MAEVLTGMSQQFLIQIRLESLAKTLTGNVVNPVDMINANNNATSNIKIEYRYKLVCHITAPDLSVIPNEILTRERQVRQTPMSKQLTMISNEILTH